VQPPPLLQVAHDAQLHRDAALRPPVPARRPARAPITTLPEAPHPALRAQAGPVGLRIGARAPGAAALPRLARAPAHGRWEAVKAGAGPSRDWRPGPGATPRLGAGGGGGAGRQPGEGEGRVEEVGVGLRIDAVVERDGERLQAARRVGGAARGDGGRRRAEGAASGCRGGEVTRRQQRQDQLRRLGDGGRCCLVPHLGLSERRRLGRVRKERLACTAVPVSFMNHPLAVHLERMRDPQTGTRVGLSPTCQRHNVSQAYRISSS
jgi:hypothetical protein